MTRRHRSSSANSIELSNPRKLSISTSKRNNGDAVDYINNVLKLFHGKDKLGRSPLHLSVISQSLGISSALLELSNDIDSFNKNANDDNSYHVRKLLLAKNEESGYTALHLSILSRDLRMILLLLRYAIMDETSNLNYTSVNNLPIHLLEGERSSDAIWENLIWNELVHMVDKDNKTSIQLLGQIVSLDLSKCRSYIEQMNQYCNARRAVPRSMMRRRRLYSFEDSVMKSRMRSNSMRSRSSSFASGEEEDDDEFYYYYSSDDDDPNYNEFQMLQEDKMVDDTNAALSDVRYGCEVLTYGSADHCALGIPDVKQSHKKNDVRPAARRVEHFAISEMGCENCAIAVAAGTYHTLILTMKGELYAFGLGKSGRLGTGDEQPRPLPTRILGSLANKKVTSIAASTNHSLCSTSQGHVYAWGSNRFGQLGIKANNQKQSSSTDQRCLPRRVDDLLKTSSSSAFVIRVAAGDKHSVALTARGEVYTWGDNRYGQLGLGGACGSTFHPPTRVESLWCNNPKERQFLANAISASELSTLVLCRPVTSSSNKVNSVYYFGHMNNYPMKVNFPSSLDKNSRPIHPVDIACAKHHSAVITSNGQVYTWGFHADPLGLDGTTSGNTKKGTFAHALPVPQLVSGILPENGGGFAVAVAASCDHTAVLTEEGNLYTWGAAHKHQILGYEGVKYQPLPRKVPGIYRAVNLAVAKEHTVLLIGTSKPKVIDYTGNGPPSLQTLSEKKISNHVDIFNVIPISLIAERMHAPLLLDYCNKFIRLNLDGVLAYSRKKYLNLYLQDALQDHNLLRFDSTSGRSLCKDGRINPLLLEFMESVMISGKQQEQRDWMKLCETFVKQWNLVLDSGHCKSSSIDTSQKPISTRYEKIKTSCSEWCTSIIKPMDLSQPTLVQQKHDILTNAVRSTKKKLTRVLKLHDSCDDQTLSKEQRLKLARRPILEADLVALMNAMQLVEQRMIHFNLFSSKCNVQVVASTKIEATTDKDEKLPQECEDEAIAKKINEDSNDNNEDKNEATEDMTYKCDACNLSCPDERSYELHINGRRHRNRLHKLEEEEKTAAALKIMENQLKSSMSAIPFQKPKNTWVKESSSQKKSVVSSFEAILKEEEAKKVRAKITVSSNRSVVKRSLSASIQEPQLKVSSLPDVLKDEEAKKVKANNVSSGNRTVMKRSSSLAIQEPLSSQGKTVVTSFQDILKEEEAKKVIAKNTVASNRSAMKRSFSSPLQEPQLKAPSTLSSLNFPSVLNNQTGSKLTTIGIKTPPPKGRARSNSTTSMLSSTTSTPTSASPWGKVTPTSANDVQTENSVKFSSSPKPSKSLLEIQQEEIHDKSKTISSGKWYLDEPQDRKKDRSESLGAIQQEQERISRVIEEQYAIEAEIYNQIQRERELQNQEEKKEQKRNSNKKKNRKDNRRRQSNRKPAAGSGSAKGISS